MRFPYVATAALLGMTALPALAQAPPVPSPAAGAGPEPGIGDSLPRMGETRALDRALAG